ncbi:hypothetical protein [Rothia mucilaginosa]|uniref:hypothetical protein n=1 Tax=Rothia mucilaginosa TaxID=43675 RepID=UPI0028EF0381|nr:hypothetical protein [Rothia mucilaginosa]
MATNKKPVKIQDIIDEVNSVWGEEHEEKRKKILVDNIIKLPLYAFFAFSLLYFSTIIVTFPSLISLSGSEGSSRIWPVREVFNIPYYIFDLRIGIISSIASLLLSLFVSVGKFADGESGLIGEARRAAYRKFARIVGYIIFTAFIFSFWHGLWAGYFNGTSYAPEIFGDWRVGPGWGKLIVAEDVNLARYGEMPLWTMLFFAWFTLASCLMLTHNDKDILLQNMPHLQNIKNISNISSMSDAYGIATTQINAYDSIPRLSIKPKEKQSSYHDLFVSKPTGYAGFKFSGKPCKYGITRWAFKYGITRWVLFAILYWVLFAILYTISFAFILSGGFNDRQSVGLAIFASIVIFVFEVLFKGLSDSYLYFYIYRMQVKAAHGFCGQVWPRVKFILNSVSMGLIRILLLLIAFLSWADPKDQASFPEGICVVFTSEKSFWYWVFIALFYIGKYFIIRRCIIKQFYRELKIQSEKHLCAALPRSTWNWKEIKPEEYLMIAYMYCTMLKINEYYSQYKDEIGIFDSEDGDESECKSEVKKAWWNRLRMKCHK